MGARKPLNALDRVFLLGETRESMMHVASLLPFSAPPGGTAKMLRTVMEELRGHVEIYQPWNLKLRFPSWLGHPLQSWEEDREFDPEYHIRRSALPSPGGERELGILVSRLHSQPIDFSRPPWEIHFIEGLEGDRFAIYLKVHHALVDGYTGAKLLASGLSHSADEMDAPLFVSRPPAARAAREAKEAGNATLDTLFEALRTQLGNSRDVLKAVLDVRKARLSKDEFLTSPLRAPKSPLNKKIGRSRRFATQQFALTRIRSVAKAYGGTLNDVVLALCSAGLHRLLSEQGSLSAEPLTAFLPVNLRPKDDPGGGNAVGAILVSLATHEEDAVERFRLIIGSSSRAKEAMQKLSKAGMTQYSAVMMAPMLMSQIPGAVNKVRPAFNVCISNVPGPDHALYFRGARLEASYPVSIPFHGYALNITVGSYNGNLNFGFIACRDAVPSMQKLAVYAADALAELELRLPGGKEAAAAAKVAKPVATVKASAVKAKPAIAKPAATKAAAAKPVKAKKAAG